MNAPRQVLRFRTAGSAGPFVSGSRIILDVWQDDLPLPVGHIVHLAVQPGIPARWAFVLSDGRVTGMQSILSRSDLEGQIMEYFFQDLIADQRHSA